MIYATDINIKYGKTDCCEDYRKFLATQNRYVIVMVFEIKESRYERLNSQTRFNSSKLETI